MLIRRTEGPAPRCAIRYDHRAPVFPSTLAATLVYFRLRVPTLEARCCARGALR